MSTQDDEVRYRAFFLVAHDDPEDKFLAVTDDDRLMDITNSTAEFRVFDEIAQTEVTVIPTSAVIAVANAGLFVVDDKVQVIQNDNVALISNVDAVDTSAGTITLADTPSPQLTAKSTVRKIYGTPGSENVAMTPQPGTPTVGQATWGWHALGDPDVFSDLVPGVEYRIESIVTKTGGTKVNDIRAACGTVQANCA